MSGASSDRYLAFTLGDQVFAVEAGRVEVVLEGAAITRVPKAPPHLRGVMNYRGAVIPVADIAVRFGQAAKPLAAGANIIVMRVNLGPEEVAIGVLASSVQEVIDLESANIERPPHLVGSRIEDGLVKGIGERGGEFVLILDVDRALCVDSPGLERGAESP